MATEIIDILRKRYDAKGYHIGPYGKADDTTELLELIEPTTFRQINLHHKVDAGTIKVVCPPEPPKHAPVFNLADPEFFDKLDRYINIIV